MNEDNNFSLIQFLPDVIESGVAEVVLCVGVAGEDGDAVGMEGVECVCDFFKQATSSSRLGRHAKKPILSGCLSRIWAQYSLLSRAIFTASLETWAPGAVNERIDFPMPAFALKSKSASMDQSGAQEPPTSSTTAIEETD